MENSEIQSNKLQNSNLSDELANANSSEVVVPISIILVMEFFLGCVFTIASGKLSNQEEFWRELAFEGAITLFLAFIVTITFEEFTRQQLIKDMRINTEKVLSLIKSESDDVVKKVQEAGIEQTLKGLAGDTVIYKELKKYAIRRPFIRRQCYAKIIFEWKENSNKKYFSKKRFFYHVAENLLDEPLPYKVKAFEEFEENFGEKPKVTKIIISPQQLWDKPYPRPDDKNDEKSQEKFKDAKFYSAKSIEDFKKNKDGILILSESDISSLFSQDSQQYNLYYKYNEMHLKLEMLEVTPENPLAIGVEIEAFSKTQGTYNFLMVEITDGLNVEVYYPEDINFDIVSLHPDENCFKCECEILPSNNHQIKQHKCEINAGILPYQGVSLKWAIGE